ncbi:MAG: MFS transporter [Chitinivorax sp.]
MNAVALITAQQARVLGGFYFFYFAFVGAFSPYWGLYLQSLHFSAWQIGVLMSLTQVMRIFAPNVWGWVADRSGKRAAIVRLAALISAASFAGVFAGQGFAWLFVALAIMSFFWSASLPLVEATTLSLLGSQAGRYSRIRVWGSVGFVVATVFIGHLLEQIGVAHLPASVMLLVVGIAVYAWFIPEAPVAKHAVDSGSLWDILRQPAVAALFLSCFFMALTHGPYYTFYSIHLAEHGYSESAIGYLWSVGVVAEICAFVMMPRIIDWLGLRRLFLLGLLLAVLRFLMIAWLAQSVWAMALAQLMHAATFGTHHATSIALIHRFFQGRHQARGQALYISASFGLGGTLGGLVTGALWTWLGAPWIFTLAAISAAIGLGLAQRWLRL